MGAQPLQSSIEAGLSPAGNVNFGSEKYSILDTRTLKGFDFGIYYDLASSVGDWAFTWVGSVYTKYTQTPGDLASTIIKAQ